MAYERRGQVWQHQKKGLLENTAETKRRKENPQAYFLLPQVLASQEQLPEGGGSRGDNEKIDNLGAGQEGER